MTLLHSTRCSLLAATLILVTNGQSLAKIAIDLVTVGDPANPGNPANARHAGAVGYTYDIGKYEVTLNQYAAFLNAVAAIDTYGLFNSGMTTDLDVAGIRRFGSPGSFGYSVIGDGNRPITYVGWLDAARFMNWLHNGQPTGAEVAGITETGAYTLNGATSGLFPTTANAAYWLPSHSEWYKAAYYQPAAAGGDSDGYWLYATQSNDLPNSRNGSTTDPNSANFIRDDGISGNGVNDRFAVSQGFEQNKLTPVGAYTLADSYYGTFDQVGNVYEYTSTPSEGGEGDRRRRIVGSRVPLGQPGLRPTR